MTICLRHVIRRFDKCIVVQVGFSIYGIGVDIDAAQLEDIQLTS